MKGEGTSEVHDGQVRAKEKRQQILCTQRKSCAGPNVPGTLGRELKVTGKGTRAAAFNLPATHAWHLSRNAPSSILTSSIAGACRKYMHERLHKPLYDLLKLLMRRKAVTIKINNVWLKISETDHGSPQLPSSYFLTGM